MWFILIILILLTLAGGMNSNSPVAHLMDTRRIHILLAIVIIYKIIF